MELSCNPSFWEASPGGLGVQFPHGENNSNINSGILYNVSVPTEIVVLPKGDT